jgi:hypothetical protein
MAIVGTENPSEAERLHRRMMRYCLTGLAAILGSGVALGLVQANVQEWARANNQDQYLVRYVGLTMNSGLAEITQSMAFQAVAWAVIGAAIAVWIDFAIRRWSKNKTIVTLCALGILVVLIGVGWFYFSPRAPILTEQEKKDRIANIDRLMVQLNMMKAASDRAKYVLENWQSQAMTDPSGLTVAILLISAGFYASFELKSLERSFANRKGTADLFKADFPDCYGKTSAFNSEINRITGHKAELLFTLQNNTKLADFRSTMPDCEKWINSRIEAAEERRQQYN